MEAKVIQQLLLLLARSGKNGENPLRMIFTVLSTALCAVVLLVAMVAYILTAPFELSPELIDFQSAFSGLIAKEVNIDASVLTAAQIRALTGDIADADREAIIATALSLVGKVPYFWGGKSAPGWNDAWGTPRLVTAPGSSTSGTYIPYGLDCSGFVNWVFRTALGEDTMEGQGTSGIWYETESLSRTELQPGDLAFKNPPNAGGVNHVGIYLGKDADGKNIYIHCSFSGGGVVMNSYSGFRYFRRPNILTEGDFL